MLTAGLYMMPLDLRGKGYLAMGILMLVQTTVNITKTLRDNAESDKLIRKIEDAKTEKSSSLISIAAMKVKTS